jgi:hypothetical protein
VSFEQIEIGLSKLGLKKNKKSHLNEEMAGIAEGKWEWKE